MVRGRSDAHRGLYGGVDIITCQLNRAGWRAREHGGTNEHGSHQPEQSRSKMCIKRLRVFLKQVCH